MTKCPHCGKHVKGHDQGTKDFRELSREQQIAAIGQATKNLNAMKKIYDEVPQHQQQGDGW